MIVRSKTKRRVLLLVLSAVILLSAAAGIYVFRKYQIRQDFLASRDRGLAAFKAGDFSTAASEIGRYVGRYRGDMEIRYYFGEALHQSDPGDGRNYMGAVFHLRQFVDAHPDRKDVWRTLAKLNSRMGRSAEAIEAADQLLAGGQTDAEALRARSQAYAALRQFDKALPDAERLTQLDPKDLSAQVLVLQLYAQLSRAAEILPRAEKIFTEFPGDARAQLLLSVAYSLTSEFTDAQKAHAWELALKIDPTQELLKQQVQSVSKENYTPALASLLFALKAAQQQPTDADQALLNMRQLERFGLVRESTALLEKAQVLKDNPQARQLLLRRLWESNRFQELENRLSGTKLEPTTPANVELMGMRAIALFGLNQREPASAIAAQLTARTADPVAQAWASILNGIIFSQGGDLLKVLEPIRKGLEAQPNNGYFRYFTGEVYAALDEQDLAIDAFRQAIAPSASPTWALPHFRLSRLLLEVGQKQNALEEADRARRLLPEVQMVANQALIWAAVLGNDGMLKEPRLSALVEQIQKAVPGEEQTLALYVRLLAANGKSDDARKILSQALAAPKPHRFNTLVALAQASRSAQLGMEEECYQAAQKAYGMGPQLAYIKAHDLLADRKADQATKFFSDARSAAKDPRNISWRLAWARLLDESSDKRAPEEWKALGDDPALASSLMVQRAAMDAHCALDAGFKARTIERVKALTGANGAAWRMARAKSILQESPGHAAEATQLLSEVVKNAFTDVEARRLLAASMLRSGNVAGAIEQMSAAVMLDPSSVPMMLELARLYQSQGDIQRATEVANRILRGTPSSGDRLSAAQLLLSLGDPERAAAAVEGLPDSQLNSAGRLFLAELARARNRMDEAATRYEKLLQSPNYLAIVSASSFYASTGHKAQAEKTLALLDRLDLEPGWKDLALAAYQERFGTAQAALGHFQSALRAQPGNPAAHAGQIRLLLNMGKTDEAISAIDAAAKAVPTNSIFALLQSKAALIKRVPPQGSVGQLILSVFEDPADSRIALEAAQVIMDGAQNKEPPAAVLEKVRPLADRAPRLAPLQSAVAGVYQRLGKPREAATILVRTAQALPSSPEMAAEAARALAGSGDWAQALLLARQWRKNTPANPLPADLFIADALAQTGDLPAASDQLKPYLENAKAHPEDLSPVLAVQVGIWLRQDKSQAVADLLTPSLPNSSRARLIWIDTLQFLPQNQALAWFKQVTPHIPANAAQERLALAMTSYNLGMKFQDESLRSQGRKMLEALVAQDEKNVSARYSLAVVYEQDGTLDLAEAAYRKVLQLAPDDVRALNNLAMLISRRGENLQEALELARKTVKAQPNVATFLDTLAYVQLHLKDYAGAVDSLTQAVRLEPSNLQWRIALASAHVAGGDSANAGRVLNEIETLLPSQRQLSPALQERLSQLRTKLGRKPPTQPSSAPAAAGI